MQLAICDDNLNFLAQLEEYLHTLPQVKSVAAFSTLDSFLLSVETGARYDAVLLDINWNQSQNGMDIAEQLLVLSPQTQIIYITGYGDRFAQQIFLQKPNLSGYLTKPIDPGLLQANLEKAAKAKEVAPPMITILSQGKPISLPTDEILYLESQGHTIYIHTAVAIISIYRRLDDIVRLLPDNFYRCHKSYLVNLRQIRRIQQPDLLLKSGHKVPVSRSRYAETKEAYLRFVGQSF